MMGIYGRVVKTAEGMHGKVQSGEGIAIFGIRLIDALFWWRKEYRRRVPLMLRHWHLHGVMEGQQISTLGAEAHATGRGWPDAWGDDGGLDWTIIFCWVPTNEFETRLTFTTRAVRTEQVSTITLYLTALSWPVIVIDITSCL